MEVQRLASRKIYAVMPPKVEYNLTEFGKRLVLVIDAIGSWGDQHDECLRVLLLKQDAALS